MTGPRPGDGPGKDVLESLPGRQVGSYRFESVLGFGAMGMVFRGTHVDLDRPVAIKVLGPAARNDRGLIRRFEREIQLHRRLSHPHVVRVFDTGLVDQIPYIVMELVEGGSLRDRLARPPLPTVIEVLEMGLQMVDALEYLHHEGILHRDLKTANILVGPLNHIHIVDFGLARDQLETRLTLPGQLVGTPTHMAPELIEEAPHSTASDAFALGMILYEMTTGTLPYRTTTLKEWVRQLLEANPPPLRRDDAFVPPLVDRVVRGLLARDPDARPTLQEVRESLTTLLSSDSRATIPHGPLSVTNVPRPFAARLEARTSMLPVSTIGPAKKSPAATGWSPTRRGAAVLVLAGMVVGAALLALRHPGSQAPVAAPTPVAGDDPRQLYRRAEELAAGGENGAMVLELHTKAARAGLADAQYRLGLSYAKGEGVSRNDAIAIEWLERAARQQHHDASAWLAVLLIDGRGVPRDVDRALKLLEAAATGGSVMAASELGMRRMTGMGIPADHAEAYRWVKRAADQDDRIAQNNLGVLYERGLGVKPDPVQAVAWYTRSAAQGYAQAQINLAVMKIKGQGTPRDPAGAVKLLEEPARSGMLDAQFNLGSLHVRGEGVPQDFHQAAHWYRKAADAGHALSQLALGEIYQNGQGVPRDARQAAYWYRRADASGAPGALDRLATLAVTDGGPPAPARR